MLGRGQTSRECSKRFQARGEFNQRERKSGKISNKNLATPLAKKLPACLERISAGVKVLSQKRRIHVYHGGNRLWRKRN